MPTTRPASIDSIGKPGTPWPAVGVVLNVRRVDTVVFVDVSYVEVNVVVVDGDVEVLVLVAVSETVVVEVEV
jgi:hypothetical protein